ncbi:MAG: outer membrane beta-barrel protein [Telluria sp.]
MARLPPFASPVSLRCALLAALLTRAAPALAQYAPGDAYLSGQLGNGLISGGNARGDRGMNWLAFEARGGRVLDPALLGIRTGSGSGVRIDVMYYNEGHPENNHRDGLGLQFTYVRRLADWLTAEVGAGPYTSMNTTTINGVEIDQARTGILYTVALRYPLAALGPGTQLRLGYNHVWMHDVHHSDALMLGLDHDFTGAETQAPAVASGAVILGGAIGRSITNQAGGDAAFNFMAQARYRAGIWALSASAIDEGDDQRRVDRHGIALQGWFVQPLTREWKFAAGLGPYLARNNRAGEGNDTLGLFTVQLERAISPASTAFFAFNRVKTFHEREDRDLFQLGVMTNFGR